MFEEPRVSAGVGIRIRVPGLGFIPIGIDFAHPILYEETDARTSVHFRLGLLDFF
jgi:outer membrane protein assembly factor BamA